MYLLPLPPKEIHTNLSFAKLLTYSCEKTSTSSSDNLIISACSNIILYLEIASSLLEKMSVL